MTGISREHITRKHPHLRGEDIAGSDKGTAYSETPPPAWGRLSSDNIRARGCGNTPTCVGKTKSPRRQAKPSEKHPHLRGEDLIIPAFLLLRIETPPPAWGRRLMGRPWYMASGNTPTCVGKTANRNRLSFFCKKHPHLRGEDFSNCKLQSNGKETPPPAWGRQFGFSSL